MSAQPSRGSGRTTKQILEAPRGAFYVWVNHHLDYPKQLARKLCRDDLRIVSPSFLDGDQWYGWRRPLRLDHACSLTERQAIVADLIHSRSKQ